MIRMKEMRERRQGDLRARLQITVVRLSKESARGDYCLNLHVARRTAMPRVTAERRETSLDPMQKGSILLHLSAAVRPSARHR
jgi:hypothetical protein